MSNEIGLKRKNIIQSLEGLRAIAFLGIFLSHSGVRELNVGGSWGVSIFIILSGFLLTLKHYGTKTITDLKFQSSFNYARKKIGKLYPLHIFMMIISIIIGWQSLRNNGNELALKTISNILLIQAYIPISGYYFSLNAVAWYLSMIFMGYFMFPYILYFITKRFSGKLSALIFLTLLYILQLAVGCCSAIINQNILGSDGFFKWAVYISPFSRVIDFAIGCCTAYIFLENKNKVLAKSSYNIISILIPLFLTCTFGLFVYFFQPADELKHNESWWLYSSLFTPINVVIIYFLAKDKGIIASFLKNKYLVWIGSLSGYSFLIHQITLKITGYALSRISAGGSVFIIVKILCSFIFTLIFSYLWKELVLRVLEKRNNGRKE